VTRTVTALGVVTGRTRGGRGFSFKRTPNGDVVGSTCLSHRLRYSIRKRSVLITRTGCGYEKNNKQINKLNYGRCKRVFGVNWLNMFVKITFQ
jgi:hypothetical protein